MFDTQHNANQSKRRFFILASIFHVFVHVYAYAPLSINVASNYALRLILIINRLVKNGGKKWGKMGKTVFFITI